MLPQCKDFTTMATLMNGFQTLPSRSDKATVTMSLAMVNRLLDWANAECDNPEDIYKVMENLSGINFGSVVDLDSWNNIVPCSQDTTDVEYTEVIPTTPNDTISNDDSVINDEIPEEPEVNNAPDEDVIIDISNLFDETEQEGQDALRQYQARFNIVPEEPTIENPVIDSNEVLSPEIEEEINRIVANGKF